MQFSLQYAQSFQPSQCQVAQASSNKLTYILNFSIVTSPSPLCGKGGFYIWLILRTINPLTIMIVSGCFCLYPNLFSLFKVIDYFLNLICKLSLIYTCPSFPLKSEPKLCLVRLPRSKRVL